MDARDAIKLSIDAADMISMAYLADLSDAELMHRPTPGCNHINWQVGHLIASEHKMNEQALPGSMPPLPEGFAERYTESRATSDNPAEFSTKSELLALHGVQRASTLACLAQLTDADLERATGIEYAPTVASLFTMHGCHWLMHAGQWAVVRRQLGRPPLF